MDGRGFRESMRRLRHLAAEVSPEAAAGVMEPFVALWKPVTVPNLKDGVVPMDAEFRLSEPALVDLAARIRVIGMNLNKRGLRGVEYHNALQRQLAALAATFDCQGWTESAALFDDPEVAGAGGSAAAEMPAQIAGRVDVVWSRKRVPVVVLEVDSTVKARSFQKLKEAAAPHKVWVYFGKDVWGFKTFLQKEDAGREVLAVVVPRTFVPSFEDATHEDAEDGQDREGELE
jgi:hypothetical protein